MRGGKRIVAVALLLTAPALGKQEYHDALVAGTGTCHDCSLCHPGPVGLATPTSDLFATKPFLRYMYIEGMKTGSIPDPTQDSDLDTFSDIAELTPDESGKFVGDPNDASVGPGQFPCPTGPEPEYGCARVAAAPVKGHGWALAAALLPALVLWRRRR